MTDQEAVEFYLNKASLKIWHRLVFFVALFTIGWAFMTPLFWEVSPPFAEKAFVVIAPTFFISYLVWTAVSLPKHFSALRELHRRGYKKAWLFQWNPRLVVKCAYGSFMPTRKECLQYPWLLPVSVAALLFPVFGFFVFVVSFLPVAGTWIGPF